MPDTTLGLPTTYSESQAVTVTSLIWRQIVLVISLYQATLTVKRLDLSPILMGPVVLVTKL